MKDALTHLRQLEAESIHIMREVAAEFRRPVMLYSIGKDSSVMLHIAMKAFYPGRPPFPLLHVDTTWKFREMIEFRDREAARLGLDLIVHVNEVGLKRGISPIEHGSQVHTDVMKTEGLKQALDSYGFDAAFGGARRDEEKSRAKERVFLAALQCACRQGRKHSRLSALQLDGAGHLAVHPSGADQDRAALLRGTPSGRRA
jgi:sulfate adenylyltransferase subunit 2